ncbi:hypothetical protein EYF80_026170 [Liparis tanakae]|uniref:Uncharacterized protein n=1 Tax=Liparis tanakae TaxID=230148 RepID=A0A4Z2HFD6_9TELE|nr:hypothetical protein EYF80_026170 [Liparis tanakae]
MMGKNSGDFLEVGSGELDVFLPACQGTVTALGRSSQLRRIRPTLSSSPLIATESPLGRDLDGTERDVKLATPEESAHLGRCASSHPVRHKAHNTKVRAGLPEVTDTGETNMLLSTWST